MRLMIPLFAMLAVRPDAQGCNLPVETVAHDGRIGVSGWAMGKGVMVEQVGVGTPADRAIDPGDLILAVDGVTLTGPHAFEDLRRLAGGVPGTEVEVTLLDEHGTREVTLTREAFGDDIPRRTGSGRPGSAIWAGDY